MKTMHLFSGAGGGLLTDLVLGHDPIIAVENDKFCCELLRRRSEEGWFPNLYMWEGDIKMFDPSKWQGKVDCIHAGWPCQDISVVGSGKGIHGEKSGLWKEIVRIAGIIRPQYLFLENSPAITYRGLNVVVTDLAKLGYDAVWAVIPASAVGAPHRRDRWWCLAKMSNSSCGGLQGPTKKSSTQPWWASFIITNNSEILANTDSINAPWLASEHEKSRNRRQIRLYSRAGGISEFNWWQTESDVGRVAHGVANRVDRIKALGNGWVPLQAAFAFILLYNLINCGVSNV